MIYCLGRHGVLSKELLGSSSITSAGGAKEVPLGRNNVVILTYSPTQRQENKRAYTDETRYYRDMVKYFEELGSNAPRIVYISSQTVLQNSKSIYGRAKLYIEKRLRRSNLNVMIIRPGFIFDKKGRLMNKGMQALASMPLTLLGNKRLFSACRASDLMRYIEEYEKGVLCTQEKQETVQLGLRLMSLCEILDLDRKYAYRIRVPKQIIRFASIFNKKLLKLTVAGSGVVCSTYGLAGYYDSI